MSVLLADNYDGKFDPTGWWMSEKLDGVRAVWDGRNLQSRNGNIFPVPRWFVEGWPLNLAMDGELWLGRGVLEDTVSIVKSGSKDKGWNRLVYMVFDIPDRKAGVVEERWDRLRETVRDVGVKQLQFVPQTPCQSKEQLYKLLDIVAGQGAEGLMLRQPRSLYDYKRSSTLLKVKKYIYDEATVVAYQESEIETAGKAHLIGSMGALICDSKFGRIKIGTGFSENVRLNPPKIGAVITYKYLKLTAKGVPYAPVFVAVRDYE